MNTPIEIVIPDKISVTIEQLPYFPDVPGVSVTRAEADGRLHSYHLAPADEGVYICVNGDPLWLITFTLEGVLTLATIQHPQGNLTYEQHDPHTLV